MRKLVLISIIASFLLSCEKSSDKLNKSVTARIVGFYMNCSACILEFPFDNLLVSEEIGRSPNNYYKAVNLSKTDYEIGQMLKVKIRVPVENETQLCDEMDPFYNHTIVPITDVFITDVESFNSLIFNEKILLSCKDCLYDPETRIYLCFDSVLNDSRCPAGVYCIWEGNAEVRFKLEKYDNRTIVFDLNTHAGFTTDTIVSGYKITLLNLDPYPVVDHRINQNDYKAEILIEKE